MAALRGPSTGGSLFASDVDYERLLDLSVGELREMFAVPPSGLTNRPRGLHAHAPACSVCNGSAS